MKPVVNLQLEVRGGLFVVRLKSPGDATLPKGRFKVNLHLDETIIEGILQTKVALKQLSPVFHSISLRINWTQKRSMQFPDHTLVLIAFEEGGKEFRFLFSDEEKKKLLHWAVGKA